MHILLHILILTIHITWGILQNILGFMIFLYFYIRNPKRDIMIYHMSIVTDWDYKNGCMGLGMFIFINDFRRKDNEFILMHEYGHSIQSLILGPLFIPLIAIPSLIWASSKSLKNYRQIHKISYYDLYTEKWANHLSRRVLKNRL